MQDWKKLIFSEELSFAEKARKVFMYQFENNEVYRRFCIALHNIRDINSSNFEDNAKPGITSNVKDNILTGIRKSGDPIPLFPIRGFKDARLTSRPDTDPDLIFKSSGTSEMNRSVHQVDDAALYRESLLRGFSHFYETSKTIILAYTPGYSDNPDSSLIWMLRELISQDQSGISRFLPLNEPLEQEVIDDIEASGYRIILFGAAFGLIDLVNSSEVSLPGNSIIIETGGMKTHKRELKRMEMHRRLAEGFGIAADRVHSEYGMAELLSQAYATGGKWFRSVPWMTVSVRDPDNPQQALPPYHEGLIGIVDLANIHSCSFILTGDKGMVDDKGRFQVLGRWNPKDLRGCNFLIDED